jgi:SAM-dependent methyltransferase
MHWAGQEQGRLLDVGCGAGYFLSGMRRHGWEVSGLEVSRRAAQIAERDYGLEVRVGELGSMAFAASSFDVVTLWNVLEHLPSPKGDLRIIHDILRPGGLLAFGIPNAASLDARVFGRFWAGLDMPRHLHVFAPEALGRMLTELGFRVAGRRCFFGAHGAFCLSLRFCLEEKWGHSLPTRLLLSTIECRLARLTLSPYFYLLDRLGYGSIVTYFCKRA